MKQERLTTDQQQLVADNVHLAHWYCMRLGRRLAEIYPTLDDAIQEATLGLIRAAQTWQPSKGRFSTWATFQMRAYLQRNGSKQRGIPVPSYLSKRGLPCTIPVGTLNEQMAGALVEDREIEIEHQESEERVAKLLADLVQSPREREFVRLWLFEGVPAGKAADELDMSPVAVRSMRERLRHRIKRALVTSLQGK